MSPTRRLLWLTVLALVLLGTFAAGWVIGRTGIGSVVDPASLTDLERQFAERLSGSALVGSFTVDGRNGRAASPDRYDLSHVEKVGDDLWRFSVRMRHSDVDVTMPITVPMRWIGDTPVIELTNYSIPTLGTFTARVFFYDERYAGTWQHGQEIGGHLFGRIEKQ
jgi:hypothetical protein